MRKLSDDYSSEVALKKLNSRFESSNAVASTIKKLTEKELCTLAALCDGNTITTMGYNITADYGVNRASAVVHSLKEKCSIPIASVSVNTISDVNNATKQSKFFITSEDLDRLSTDPDMVLRNFQRESLLRKETLAQKEIKRLLRDYGKDGILALIEHAANDDNASDKVSSKN
ncbi:TPA: hypothetical protein PXJ35_004447 [Yersinia enterocolitica]|nr:hypothetical protein [Yersinia enterocolitica]HDL6658100.1 hypothetical protein [Yersinia enterocolitica]HDL6684213.1 hypothetical protein [Yersinia enterocolitica]